MKIPAFVFLSINVMDPEEAKARAFIAEKKLPYDVVLDPESDLIDRLEATAFPWNMIIGPDGQDGIFLTEISIGLHETLRKSPEKLTPSEFRWVKRGRCR